jgi:multidrug resistance efflux pump
VPTASKVIFFTVSVLTVAETAGFAGTYLLYSRHYVYTDNATVDGDRIDINAPTTGAVVDWSLNQGSTVRPNQVVGRIRRVGGGGQPERTIRSPGRGTVAVTSVVDGVYVTEGTELATAYDFSKIYVTARIDADDLGEVHPGALADVAVDAFPHTPVRGIVETVQGSTAGNFTIYPPVGTANPSQPQRVDQYVPVRIAFLETGGKRLVPGMNVSVHIRRD